MEHIPVLFNEIMEHIHQTQPKTFLDVTFGRGGHVRGVFEASPEVKIVGVDQDQQALDYGRENFSAQINSKKLFLFHDNFVHIDKLRVEIEEQTGIQGFDGILADLGVSSPQLDEAERGFSFNKEGPLDMRMNREADVTAAEIVNSWSAEELEELFRTYGEVFKPGRVVRAIVHDRESEPFTSTRQLASLIERVEGWRRKGHHPATKYFLALRLEVNKELQVAQQVLPLLVDCLNEEGLLFVISFHSLEDRIIKRGLKELLSQGELVNKKVIQEKWEMKKKNPRSRSAKLRIFRKKTKEGQSE